MDLVESHPMEIPPATMVLLESLQETMVHPPIPMEISMLTLETAELDLTTNPPPPHKSTNTTTQESKCPILNTVHLQPHQTSTFQATLSIKHQAMDKTIQML